MWHWMRDPNSSWYRFQFITQHNDNNAPSRTINLQQMLELGWHSQNNIHLLPFVKSQNKCQINGDAYDAESPNLSKRASNQLAIVVPKVFPFHLWLSMVSLNKSSSIMIFIAIANLIYI
mmetsp:Transcript_25235/g.60692  ORF Transcript_25235/g.60692 Transcript_25235/m.60692 type:complete len:119 (+) Transcript_25235:2742-3098(+)